MGKLHAIGNLEIRVFGRDYRPAHFHVLHPDGDALVDIPTLTALRGMLPRHHRHQVLTWAALNRAAIVAEWNRLNPDLSI